MAGDLPIVIAMNKSDITTPLTKEAKAQLNRLRLHGLSVVKLSVRACWNVEEPLLQLLKVWYGSAVEILPEPVILDTTEPTEELAAEWRREVAALEA